LPDGGVGECHAKLLEVRVMAWIFVSFIAFCQQQSALQVTPIDGLETGLKNSGCMWISVALGRTSETENQTFSMGWRFLRNPLDNNYGLS
jgi:hypothetical protein